MTRREALKRTAAITGFTVTSSVGIGILEGCSPSGKPGWQPGYLNKDQVILISSIAEIILPKTVTPGAIDLNIPEFIDIMLADCFNQKKQHEFQTSMNEFKVKIYNKYHRDFEKCSVEEKINIIAEEQERSYENYHKTFTKSFYLVIKELTLLGYYTSEYVMNNMLDYHPVPGRYDGCIPLIDDGKVYVDNNVLPS